MGAHERDKPRSIGLGMSWQCLEHKGTDVAGAAFDKYAKAHLDASGDVTCVAPVANASSCAWLNSKAECAAVDATGLATTTCSSYADASGWCNDLRQQLVNNSKPLPPSNNTEAIVSVLSSAWTCTTFTTSEITLSAIDPAAGVECLAASATDCLWFTSVRDCWSHALAMPDVAGRNLSCAAVLKLTPTTPPSTSYKWCQSVLHSFANNTIENATHTDMSSSSLSTTTVLLIILVCVVFSASLVFFVYMRRQYHRSMSSSSFFDDPKLQIEYPASEQNVYGQPKESLVHDSLPPPVVNRPRDLVLAGSFSSVGVGSSSNGTPNGGNDTILGICLDMGDLALWRLDETQLQPVKTLATGANGVVCLALYKQTQHVAVKKQLGELTPESVQTFIDEIKLSSRLDSPYIVQFIGASWVRPRNIEMVVEYMEGGDLRCLLARDPPLVTSWPSYKVQVAVDVLNGLLYLHSMDIVHRDLKARNVLLTTTLRAKLTDFGVSRMVSEHGTMTMGVGTFRWAAPEVFRDHKYTVAADIYSFGMLLVELATHDVPYATVDISTYALMQALRDGQPRPPPYSPTPDCPSFVHTMIQDCLQDDPAARPTAMDLAARLSEHLPAQPEINGNVECQRHSLDADENTCYWIANVASYCTWYNANPTGFTIECTDYSNKNGYCYKVRQVLAPPSPTAAPKPDPTPAPPAPTQAPVPPSPSSVPSSPSPPSPTGVPATNAPGTPEATTTPSTGEPASKPTSDAGLPSLSPAPSSSSHDTPATSTFASTVPPPALLLATTDWNCLKNADSQQYTPARIDPEQGQLQCLTGTTSPQTTCNYSADAATCQAWLAGVQSCWLSDAKTTIRASSGCPKIILVPSRPPTSAASGPSASVGPSVSWVIVAAAAVAVVALVVVVVWYRRRQRAWAKTETPNASYMFCWTDKEPKDSVNTSMDTQDDVVGGQLNMGDLVLWRLDEAKLASQKVLSVGAFGVVSLGSYLGKPVAIKQLVGEKSTATVQAFIDEICLMTKLDSPFVVSLLGCAWVRPRDIQLVVEFMDQGDLRQLLTVAPTLSWTVKVQLAKDIAQGLVYLHSLDIIHRDIKSRNVLLHKVSHALRAKLTDFGISRIVDTDMTARVGTFRWTAPEVLEGNAYSLAADVYSVGMVLWELDLHNVPFSNMETGWNEYQWIEALKDGGVKPECSASCPLAHIVQQCTMYTPTDRPSALELAVLLDEVCALDSASGQCFSTPSQAQCEALQQRSLVGKPCSDMSAATACAKANASLPPLPTASPWSCIYNHGTNATALTKTGDGTVCFTEDHAVCKWFATETACAELQATVPAFAPGLSCTNATAPSAMDWCPTSAPTTAPAPASSGMSASAAFWVIVGGVVVVVVLLAVIFYKCFPHSQRRRWPAASPALGPVLESDKTFCYQHTAAKDESHADSSIGDDAVLQAVVVRPQVAHLESLTIASKLELGDLAFWRLDESQLQTLATLSAGMYGTVSVGRYRDQLVAIKTPLASERSVPIIQAFLDEIALMTRVQSPYVVRVIGISYVRLLDVELVMEYMDKGDLKHYLEVTRANAAVLFPWPQKITCARDIAKGLLALHDARIIHRDLKSRNVLFNHAMQAKIGDFGVAREVTTATMTQGVGSYRWTAPEVLEGRKYSVAADIYSFGMILSELDTHHVPYYDLQQPPDTLRDFVLLRERPARLVNVSDGVLMERVMDGGVEPSFSTSCPDAVYNLALQCIDFHPTRRPTAREITLLVLLLVPVLAVATTDWACVRINGAIDAFRVNEDGDIECGSKDGRSCTWVQSKGKCDSTPSDALACGAMHKRIYGITGYDDPTHWCSQMRLVLGPDYSGADNDHGAGDNRGASDNCGTSDDSTAEDQATRQNNRRADCGTSRFSDADSDHPGNKRDRHADANANDLRCKPQRSGAMTTVGYLVLALGVAVCSGACAFFVMRRRRKHKEQLDTLMWAETHKSLACMEVARSQEPASTAFYEEGTPYKPHAPPASSSARATEQSCDMDDGFDAVMPAFDTIYSNDNSSFLVQEAKADAALLEDLELWRLDSAQLQLTELLSQSQDKEVWRGVYDDEVVAVKTLKVHSMDTATAKFVKEIQLLMKLDSPNIVAMYGVLYDGDRIKESVQLVYEYMDNGNLAQYLARTPMHAMHWTEKVQYAIDIATGLGYLHARGIIHRDLKCKHVLVNSAMQVKLTDFGGSREADVFMTQGAGTLRWTAPEVYAGSSYTVAADIYSLGMVLLELQTHTEPFARETNAKGRPLNDFEVMMRVQDRSLVAAFPQDSPFHAIGRQCTAWDPALRPTPDEIAAALQEELTRATMSF
ncbi:protein kinase [Achlya hypogyna]|uniref:Protein kinase n=1 Tax=Achlya hypogyna TaxID=1202772 RepID=A0A1V9YIT5_ACHHY|nr:protein kinase [Achlya hypogyna]